MLLDPLKEEFNLPAALIEGADGRGWQAELVGEENECLGGFGIAEAYPAQMLWIALGGVMTAECDGLIADDAGCAVNWGRVDAVGIHIRFGARDEERAGQMHTVKPAEIDVAAIHDIDGASLGEQQIECVDVVELAVVWIKLGIFPRKSSSVCIFTAALAVRKCA